MRAGPRPRDVPSLEATSVSRLADDLRRADYTVEGVESLLGPVATAAMHREQDIPADRATTADRSPLSTLIRAFALGRPVSGAELALALPSLGVHNAVRLGIVCPIGSGAMRAMCDLRPYGEDDTTFWLASDLSAAATGAPLRLDHVLGVGGASATLAQWTIRRRVGTALDLGTGCGVQALHLVGRAGQVVATDISARALGFAEFNFALNGLQVVCRQGDLFEPVADQTFDLLVSNPPFVVTPRSAGVPVYEYRDAGRIGDTFVRELLTGIPARLNPGGVAQFLANWEIPRGSTWQETCRAWVAGLGLDAWVIQRETQDPAEYAELWSRDAGVESRSSAFEMLYGAWLDDFAARDVERIGFGVVTLHKPTSGRETWADFEDLRTPVGAGVAARVEECLDARNWLADNGIDAMLDQAWVCSPDVVEQRFSQPGDDRPLILQATRGAPLPRTVTVDAATAALLSVCDGELTARAALLAIAELLDEAPERTRADVIPRFRRLVADGFVIRRDGRKTSL